MRRGALDARGAASPGDRPSGARRQMHGVRARRLAQITNVASLLHCFKHIFRMFARLLDIDLQTDYAAPYEENRAAYLADAEALKKATGPYKAARDAYVAATATFTKSLYE